MKKAIILVLILWLGSSSFAQSVTTYNQIDKSSTPKADKFFKRMWYKEAAKIYERELNSLSKKKNRDIDYLRVLKKAGDSYFFNTDMKNANRIYKQLISNYYPEIEAEYVFKYAHSLEGIGEYKEAKYWMKKFSRITKKTDNRSEKYNQENKTIEDILDIEPQFILTNLSINTKYSDFGPMYYKDKLIYSSAVDSSNYHTRIYHWNEQPFLNMYVGTINKTASNVKKDGDFSENLNTIYHEATLAFSADEKRVYFTRNNYNGKLERDNKGTNHLKLYSADLIKTGEGSIAEWKNVKELPFNSENYSVGHPSVSSDGKLLYFVSDMPGSIGATDIFVVDILENQINNNKDSIYTSYSKPRNLGDNINTAGREMFPYITDNALYFASDGYLGLGGLDVYQSTAKESSFRKPVNLGAPLNSKLDDFAFIIKEDKNTGFVSSNRKLGKGDDDIYSFVRVPTKLIEIQACNQLVKGSVSNTITGETISNAKVALYNKNEELLETTITNINGAYTFTKVFDCKTKYKIVASKTGYQQKNKPLLTGTKTGETIVPLGLETLNELIVEEKGLLKIKIGIIYFALNEARVRINAAIELNKIVILMMQYPKMVIRIESHTDSRNTDSYNLSLSDKRAKSTKEYLIKSGIQPNRIDSAKGYGESQLLNKCSDGVKCSSLEHQLNRRSEFIIIKM
ncbi:flagellar motor protein MotB [Tenacibaculum sp. Bg11-29]|uniref:OmpA family protein n=1 Tax=Tenacibaculum sp. Bg11-29 TaxID=2058306 RepID=UPI000C320E63|nr:OmpA family protein [Tenacibaculum sp. Bg11-29]PKH52187.1 flagellar motor protein MotB [Tenacibaculum sp. Bg11-29]